MDNIHLLAVNAELDARLELKKWCSRVPSKSNVSDAVSRLRFTEHPDDFELVQLQWGPLLQLLL